MLQIGNTLLAIGITTGIVGVALGVLSYWGILLSSGSHPKPVLYFIDKTWWVVLGAGIAAGSAGYTIQEIVKGTFKFEWLMIIVPFIFAFYAYAAYIIIRQTLAEIKKMRGKSKKKSLYY